MSIMEVDRFLNDSRFTETAPRPPVPGEENELQSNGGISTKSSGSHKTHSSGKSERSNKSHSPAATPRRSNLDKTLVPGPHNCSESMLNDEAPLGFEPEGSAECGNTPTFIETNTSTPSYVKWAEDFQSLLDDREGVKLFKQFLDQEQCSNTLEFWFACQGIKLVPHDKPGKLVSLIKLIFKRYIRDNPLKFGLKIRKPISEKVKKSQYDHSLFDEAQAHIEEVMKNESYPQFLKSDVYVQFLQNGGESPKSSQSTSGSNSVRPLSGPLPTLHEEKELKQEDIKNNLPTTLPLNPNTLAATTILRSSYDASYNKFKRPEGVFAQPSHVHKYSFPYHVSYAPASERDSENTSDAHTDDTMSLTDSSIDGREAPYGSKRWKKNQKVMRTNQCSTNRRTGLEHHIPRTQRPAPKDRNLSETDPKAFAAILINRLESLQISREKEIYVKSLNLDATTDEESDKERCVAGSQPSNQNSDHANFWSLLEDKDEDPQGILDEHLTRIWDSSSGQTPSRSPGRHSPDRTLLSKSHFLGPSPNVSGTIQYPSFSLPGNKSLHLSDTSFNTTSKSHHLDITGLSNSVTTKGHHRNKKDNTSLSFDTTGVSDTYFEEPHFNNSKHPIQIHHHHHHHHHTPKDSSKLRISTAEHDQLLKPNTGSRYPDRVSSTLLYDDRSRAKELARQGGSNKRSNVSDSNAADSGVSSYDQPLRVPNMHDPSNSKVLNWMLDNPKISVGNNQYSTDGSDRGSSHKRSHKSGGSSKKATHDPNRSGTTANMDLGNNSLSHNYSYLSAVPNSVQPAQPISQDTSMPMLTPPNPTVQLEEARRRLIEDSDKRQKSSKSYSSSNVNQQLLNNSGVKEKRSSANTFDGSNVAGVSASGNMLPPPLPPKGIPPRHANIPPTSVAGTSFESVGDLDYSLSLPTKRKVPPQVRNSESTVVGYYFCGESIPYRTTVHSTQVTLGQFKQHISKRGSYRYFFKKPSNEFESGVVYEEVTDDADPLPLCEGKIIGKVEKVE